MKKFNEFKINESSSNIQIDLMSFVYWSHHNINSDHEIEVIEYYLEKYLKYEKNINIDIEEELRKDDEEDEDEEDERL